MKTQLNDEQMRLLAENLTGTCQSFSEAFDSEFGDDFDQDDAESRIEQFEIFLCEQCGWWCEQGEMHTDIDRQICDDCHEDLADDDE